MTFEQQIHTYGRVEIMPGGESCRSNKELKTAESYMAKITSLFLPYVLPSVPERDYFLLQEKLKSLLLEYKREER